MSQARLRFAVGTRTPGVMNRTEAAYAAHLEEQKHLGRILWWAFEGWTFRLAKLTRYTPDFAVMLHDQTLEAHEVKGYWRDDARVKIKVAAEMFPIRFVAVTKQTRKNGGGWKYEAF